MNLHNNGDLGHDKDEQAVIEGKGNECHPDQQISLFDH